MKRQRVEGFRETEEGNERERGRETERNRAREIEMHTKRVFLYDKI